MNREDIFLKLVVLLEPFNTHQRVVTEETAIALDLGLDSVAIMDFVMEVEDCFDMDIPLQVLSEIKTVGDLVSVILKHKGVS